jgi:hypothetical protein
MSGSWGCPHEIDNHCGKIKNLPCDPGMKGCVLAGRFRFADEQKNVRFYEKQRRKKVASDGAQDDAGSQE